MREMLDKKLARFEELERAMIDPDVLADSSKLAAVAREHGSLAKLANKYRGFKELNQEIADLEEMASGDDPEMRQLAEEDLAKRRADREKEWDELLDMTVGGEDANRASCVMEIRAGAGGDEAALFAGDLFRMYKKYAEDKGWKFEVLTSSPTEMGGFKEITISVEGEGCYRELQFESGGHRVQRVPETEAKGRIHTSAATVAVLPEPEEVEIDLKAGEDYREDITHASGPGGQHVNKTASAVRLTHLETGIMVFMQEEKSQHKNRAKALRILKSRVYDHFQRIKQEERDAERRSMIGSGDRSQRIRTYNFPENRLTDHRIGLTLYKLDQIVAGDVGPVISALLEHERQELRTSMDMNVEAN